MQINKSEITKILCIKLKGIGDVVLSTVVLENLKYDFPDVKIDFLTEAPGKAALEHIPLLNEIIVFDKNAGAINLIRAIRKRKYDLVIDLYSNPRTALATCLSGAKYRAGFPYRGRKYAYNLFGPVERDQYHAAQLHLEFLKSIGLSSNSAEMHFGLTSEDITFADTFISQKFKPDELLIGLSPSGGWPSKKCDPEKFAEIGDSIIENFGAKILLVWGPGDHNEAMEIVKLMNNKVILAPLTDIRKMGALISKCHVLIANDSGPMHISTALNTPVLSLHGPTAPSLQGPFGYKHDYVRLDELSCIECNLLHCPYNHECFKQLPVARVIHKLNSIFQKNNIPVRLNEKT